MRSKIGIGVLGVTVAFLLATNPVVVNAAGLIGSAQIKNNSIKSKDIKNNNVKGIDVKDNSLATTDIANGSLLAADFAAGELPFTRAFQTSVPGPIAVGTGANVTVATLNLAQAGTYVVTSKVYLNNDDASDSFIECNLTDGVVSDATSTGLQADSGEDDHRTIGALIASTTAGPTNVTFSCQRFAGGAVSANDIRIVAIRVHGLN